MSTDGTDEAPTITEIIKTIRCELVKRSASDSVSSMTIRNELGGALGELEGVMMANAAEMRAHGLEFLPDAHYVRRIKDPGFAGFDTARHPMGGVNEDCQ